MHNQVREKKQDLEGQEAKAWMDCGWLENVHFFELTLAVFLFLLV